MPFVSEDQQQQHQQQQQHSLFFPSHFSPRKRRRDFDNADFTLVAAAQQTPLYGSNVSPAQVESGAPAARSAIAYPVAKRVRIIQDASLPSGTSSTPAQQQQQQQIRPSALRAQTAPLPPRLDSGNESSTPPTATSTTTTTTTAAITTTTPSALQSPPRHALPTFSMAAILTPCHICHRRPTKKSDLESFAQCEGCGERTCYICIRECQGWTAEGLRALGGPTLAETAADRSFTMTGVEQDELNQTRSPIPDLEDDDGEIGKAGWLQGKHFKVICSRCCAERGVDGDTVCLGCLSGSSEERTT